MKTHAVVATAKGWNLVRVAANLPGAPTSVEAGPFPSRIEAVTERDRLSANLGPLCACLDPLDPRREHPRTWSTGRPACRFFTCAEEPDDPALDLIKAAGPQGIDWQAVVLHFHPEAAIKDAPVGFLSPKEAGTSDDRLWPAEEALDRLMDKGLIYEPTLARLVAV